VIDAPNYPSSEAGSATVIYAIGDIHGHVIEESPAFRTGKTEINTGAIKLVH
jgi:hypothetical protein